MRVSDISRWSECEAYALSEPPVERTHSVAAVVGTLAHAQLACIEATAEPKRITYDPITRNWTQARVHARDIAEEARRLLGVLGWTIIYQERALEGLGATGHLDLMCWKQDSGDAVLDLKTGQQIGAAWLQVGGYISLLSEDAGVWPAAQWGGVLHVQRRPLGKLVVGGLSMRPAGGLMDAWRIAYERIQQVQSGAPALRTPGIHCARCPLKSCAVRI